MTQETTNHTTSTAWRETLYLAAINCSHTITDDQIVLHRDPAKDGSALAQMADRLAAEAVPGITEQSGSAADERSDREIMLEWDEHYKSGLTNGTPFLSIVVNFARAAARAAVAGHIAGQSQTTKAQANEILSLHRQLAAEKLRADQGWQRAGAKSKECIELRERMAATKAQAEPIYQVKSLIHSEFWHDTDWNSYEWNKENKQEVRIVYATPTAQEVAQQAAPTDEVKRLRNRVSQLEAARIGYASEFALNADGEPDVGNIHANIRALKAELAATTQQAAKAAPSQWQVQIRSGSTESRDDWRKVMAWDHGHTIPQDTFATLSEALDAFAIMEAQYGEHSFRVHPLAPTTSTVSAPEEVREALRPFAELAELFDEENRGSNMPGKDSDPVMQWPRLHKHYELTVGHLRAARSALRTTTDKGEAA